MELEDLSFTDFLKETFKSMNDPGLLLVSGNSDRFNVMTIGWGIIGIIWGKPILCILVRPSRYTYSLIEKYNEFTVNVPTLEMEEIVSFCGTVSGRNHDKFKERSLTAIPGKQVKCPIIKECNIIYECKVIHKNDILPKELFPNISLEYYPQGDYHRVYFGEILTVYRH